MNLVVSMLLLNIQNYIMYKGKGIIFVGCSFTWGGGLEYFAPFKDVPDPQNNKFDKKKITFAIMNFIKANRFSRMVVNHFKMWEVNMLHCGGSNKASINQVETMFGLGEYINHTDKYFENIHMQRYSPDEIEYLIFELTDSFRNYLIDINKETPFISDANLNNNETHKDNIKNFKDITDDIIFEKIYKYHISNFNSWEEMETHFISENLKGVIDLFKNVESLGVKCKLWSWHNEYTEFIKNHDYLSKKFMTLNYENKEFDSLADLIKYNPKFKIRTSGFLLNGKPVEDDHPTPDCHKVIADSIIKSIENDLIR